MHKIIDVNPHKSFGIFLEESPFQCTLVQWFYEKKEDVDSKVPKENSSQVMLGLTFPEFMALAETVLTYKGELEKTNAVMAELISAKHK